MEDWEIEMCSEEDVLLGLIRIPENAPSGEIMAGTVRHSYRPALPVNRHGRDPSRRDPEREGISTD